VILVAFDRADALSCVIPTRLNWLVVVWLAIYICVCLRRHSKFEMVIFCNLQLHTITLLRTLLFNDQRYASFRSCCQAAFNLHKWLEFSLQL